MTILRCEVLEGIASWFTRRFPGIVAIRADSDRDVFVISVQLSDGTPQRWTPSGRILHEAQRQGRLAYFVAGTVGAVAISVIGLAVFALVDEGTIRDVGIGLMAASFGAWTSILQRSSKLRLDPFETPSHLRFQGATRIGLGLVFGLIAIAAIHANVLVPTASSNEWLAALVVFVAGFSERLMPELLSRFEGQGALPALGKQAQRADS